MSVSHPRTKILMVDHSRNDVVMPASVTSEIFSLGIREHSGIKMYGRAVVQPKASLIHDELIQFIVKLISVVTFEVSVFFSNTTRYELHH